MNDFFRAYRKARKYAIRKNAFDVLPVPDNQNKSLAGMAATTAPMSATVLGSLKGVWAPRRARHARAVGRAASVSARPPVKNAAPRLNTCTATHVVSVDLGFGVEF
jgi:hypothetical protein